MSKFAVSIKLFRPFLIFIMLLLALLAISRLGLAFWQYQRVENINVLLTVLFNGLRIDLSTVAYLLIIPAFLHPFLSAGKVAKWWLPTLRVWFFSIAILLLFMELCTPTFIQEYNLRPNRLFVEYLIYPQEVFSMIINGLLASTTVTLVILGIGGYIIWRFIVKNVLLKLIPVQTTSHAIVLSIVSLLFLAIAARGTFNHRPINPSMVYFTNDPLVNSLVLNSAYSVGFALKQLGNEKSATDIYGKMPEEKVIELVRAETELPPQAFVSDELPTLAKHTAVYQGKPKNLVIILEESLGAQFVSTLGGRNITPELDKLLDQGWAFERLYATGTRSVRGIEAVVTGFTPTPARAVVKLEKSQINFFTLASLLGRHNYQTQFIYGGESHFDNMKSFFLGNGFEQIVDFDDIENPEFVASWGASDGDLFNQSHKELSKLYASGKPFFSLIFSSSNHLPFDVPQGKTPQVTGDDARDKAIRYADYALGKFINEAKTKDYWQDTVFLIVADHDSHVHSNEAVPIGSFHIPALILNSEHNPMRDKRIVSHIDLAPTLLSLIGISDEMPMLGFDLNKTYHKERAMMQFGDNFAYLVNDNVAILQPNKAAQYYRYNYADKSLIEIPAMPELGEKALAHALIGSLAYNKAWYHQRPLVQFAKVR